MELYSKTHALNFGQWTLTIVMSAGPPTGQRMCILEKKTAFSIARL